MNQFPSVVIEKVPKKLLTHSRHPSVCKLFNVTVTPCPDFDRLDKAVDPLQDTALLHLPLSYETAQGDSPIPHIQCVSFSALSSRSATH